MNDERGIIEDHKRDPVRCDGVRISDVAALGGGLLRQVELGVGLVDADAAGFDHPESPDERPVSERSQERVNQRFEKRESRVSRQAQYDNAGAAVRRETGYVAEVHVQGDEAATFPAADFEQPAVRAAA